MALVTMLFVVACNTLLDFDQFEVGALGADGGGTDSNPADTNAPPNDVNTNNPDVNNPNPTGDAGDGGNIDAGGCIDPTGFGGRGCYRCKPTTQAQFQSACTTSKFETFDNATRIQQFDPSTPRPPIVDGGPLPPDFNPPSSSSGGVTDFDAGCPLTDTTNYPNPVMVYGATGFPMDVIAKAMGKTATIYYRQADSCQAVGAATLEQPKMTGDTTYYDSNGGAHFCRLHPDYGNSDQQNADISLSGLFPDACSGFTVAPGFTLPPGTSLDNGWKDFGGPVNPAMFAVPPTSSEKVITAEAAYRVYAFGSGSAPLAKTVSPWLDENLIFKRTGSSGTQQTIARLLGMPFDALRGVNVRSSSNMRRAIDQVSVSFPTEVNKAIGISTSEIVDVNRSQMRSLAYQHYGQPVAFYPDSDVNLFDRRPIRDGHYPLWLLLHVFSRVDGNGNAAAAPNAALEAFAGKSKGERDATVQTLVNVMASRAVPPVASVNILGALKLLGNVPSCAMTVTRLSEGADIVPFSPPAPCGCAFEAANPGSAPAECVQCSASQPCTGTTRTTCSFGYCE